MLNWSNNINPNNLLMRTNDQMYQNSHSYGSGTEGNFNQNNQHPN